MNIKLNTLLIRNFKGIQSLTIEFDGKDTTIRGDNATGKTTIKDACTWLLFSKNSLGKSDFGIKPTYKSGEVIHNLETVVSATFDINGISKTFKKTLTEKWTRKRGAATAVYSGNENSFYIDDVPKKKTEYSKAVSELISENVFKMITDPLYFNEQTDWKDRRKILIDICGDISDTDILNANPDFAPLAAELNGRTVDEYRTVLNKDMKLINKELEMIPVKINEAEMAKPNESEVQVNEEKRNELIKRINTLELNRNEVINGSDLIKLRNTVQDLKHKLATCDNVSVPVPDETPMLMKISNLRRAISEEKSKVTGIDDMQISIKHDKSILSTNWDKEFKKIFTGSECPTCHRAFPEEEVEKKKKEFNAAKAAELDEIEEKLKQKKQTEADLIFQKTTCLNTIEELETQLSAETKALEDLRLNYETKINKAKSKAEKDKALILEKIETTEAEIKNYQKETITKVAEIDKSITEAQKEKEAIDEMVMNRKLIERQEERIAELKAEQETQAAEYSKLDKLLYLTEQFIRTKVSVLNDKINSHFTYARFKLFDIQINEGVKETCEVTYEGIPYSDLNNAMRINIGLDVINTLCNKHQITAPIFIDNAEAVTQLFHTASQQIKLTVDERYKELEIERS